MQKKSIKNYSKINLMQMNNLIKSFTKNNKYNLPNVSPEHDIDKKKVIKYFTNFHLIPGWFNIEAAKVFLWLDLIQKKESIQGNLFEIGIFFGKSAIVLALMTDSKKEKLSLCDFFRAGTKFGVNQKEILAKNLQTYLEDFSFINIYEKFSSGLTKEECKDCRFFHIDGEHTLEALTSDLTLADSSIVEKGIIAIDDFFNPGCPEVTEGIFKYLERKDSLSPILISFGKLMLCKKSSYNWYHDKLNSYDWRHYINNPNLTSKETKMSGVKLTSFLYSNPPPAIKALNIKENPMTKNPLISVIIPCYNPHAEYFKEAIFSVFAQSYENWEVIIVNDGSDFEKTDSIKGFIDSLSDSRISIINLSKNKGVAEAKNIGVRAAKGEIITFLDTDDMHFPWYYKEIVYYFSNNPEYLIFATPSFYFVKNHKKKEIYLSKYEFNLIEKPLETLFPNFKFKHLLTKEEETPIRKVAKKTSLKLFINTTPRYAFKKEVFKNIKFDSNFLTSEDADLSMQILNNNELLSKTNATSLPCYLYRIYSSHSRLTQKPSIVFDHMIKLNDKYSSTHSTAYKILNCIKRSEEWDLKKPLADCLNDGATFKYIKHFAFNSKSKKEAIRQIISLIKLIIKFKIITQTLGQDIRIFKVTKAENISATNNIRERFNKYLSEYTLSQAHPYAKNFYKEIF